MDKELIQHQKTLFYNEECDDSLSLGSVEFHGLPHKSLVMAMTNELIAMHTYAEGRTNALTASALKTILTDAGYMVTVP